VWVYPQTEPGTGFSHTWRGKVSQIN
jgi:hypothetical protein